MITLSHTYRHNRLQFSPVCFLCVGFLPVSSIVLHCLGIVPLQNSLFLLILPLLTLATGSGVLNQDIGRIAFRGWVAGVIAVAVYDLSRIPFVYAGWADFIPHIGAWLQHNQDRYALIGYTWRYVGNGGGLGMAFYMIAYLMGLKDKLVEAAIAFGMFVFACLIILLALFHEAQNMMFHITPISLAGSFTGHLVFGLVLGLQARKYFGKKQEQPHVNAVAFANVGS